MPDVSVIIPVYNRGDLIRYTLESVRRASAGLAVETIVVDDGSDVPVATDLARLGFGDFARVVRQPNQGLLFARLAGLAAATGRYVLFLDSDDFIATDKLQRQITAMETSASEISYSDTARCDLAGEFDSLVPVADAAERATTDSADMLITIQPAPHSPIFRADYLRAVVRDAFFPPSPLYNPVAEIWFYHNAAPRPVRTVHVPGPLTIIGHHPATRLTNHWERLAVASLGVMEAFARTVPDTAEHARCRRLVGEKAFRAWRRLPRGFSAEIGARHLALWHRLGDPQRVDALGGGAFQLAARALGPETAGRIFRRFQNGSYERCRTMSDTEASTLLAALPAP